MKAYKLRVHSEEHSIAIQKRALELGYEWTVRGKNLNYLAGNGFLYLFSSGIIVLGKYPCVFEESELQEATLDDLYKINKPEEMTLEEVCKELGREIKIVN